MSLVDSLIIGGAEVRFSPRFQIIGDHLGPPWAAGDPCGGWSGRGVGVALFGRWTVQPSPRAPRQKEEEEEEGACGETDRPHGV